MEAKVVLPNVFGWTEAPFSSSRASSSSASALQKHNPSVPQFPLAAER